MHDTCKMILVLGLEALAYGQSVPTGPMDVQLRVDQDLNDVRARVDVRAMREFAWQAFYTITRSVPGLPRAPIWFSWCTRNEVFSCQCPEPASKLQKERVLSFNLEALPGRVPGNGFDILSSVYYSPATAHYLGTQTISTGTLAFNARAQLREKAAEFDTAVAPTADRDLPRMPSSSIVVKPAWVIVKNPANVPPNTPAMLRVWDGLDDHNNWVLAHDGLIKMDQFQRFVTLNFRGIRPRQDCEKADYPQDEPSGTVSLDDRFFFYQLCSSDRGAVNLVKPLCNGNMPAGVKCQAEDGDLLVLAGLHVITHQIEDWTWSTFWWHDEPDAGPFARGRPPKLAADSRWRNYLMDVTFDEETPRGVDGSSRAIFNPYLEAQIKDGHRSNCMSCHRLAALHCANRGNCTQPVNANFEVPTPGDPQGTLPVPLRGIDPSHALFDGAVRTRFLWSVARGASNSCSNP
jgi:hypothetical protein